MKLKPGNYWIYESFGVDSNGNGSPGTMGGGSAILFDSVYVEKDTVIGPYIYHKLMKPDEAGSKLYAAYYYRDSLSYEVDRYGNIVLGPYDHTSTFLHYIVGQSYASNDSAIRIDWTTGDVNKVMTVPAGTFTTTALMVTYTFYPFAVSNASVYTRHQYTRYAAGVGMISETMPIYIAIPNYTERRLLRYHVN